MKCTRITLAYLASMVTVIVMLVGSLSLFAPQAEAKKNKKKKQSCVVNKNHDFRFRVYFFDDSGNKVRSSKTLKAGGDNEVCGPRGSSVVVVVNEIAHTNEKFDSLWIDSKLADYYSRQKNDGCDRGIYNIKNQLRGITDCAEENYRIPELAVTDAALAKMKAVNHKRRTIFRGKLGVGGYNHLCFLDKMEKKNQTVEFTYYPIIMYKGREGDKCRNKRNP